MITVLKWKKACVNLFITYFNIELKRTKLTSLTDTKPGMFSYNNTLPCVNKTYHICPWADIEAKI
jgi:hypothetical protein